MTDDYQPASDLLKDRVIVVTGAGDGIGRAAAHAFAGHGATVVLLGRTLGKLEQVYDAIEAEGGPQPAIYPLNLDAAVPNDYEQLGKTLGGEFGRLDGLLHNAGLLGYRQPLAQYPYESWQHVMQVNVNAELLLTQALLPLMHNADDASIVFTSSGVGRKGRAYWGAYSVSKFATEGMAQIWADELENTSNIRVNCINPGATRTRMRAQAYPAEDPQSLPEPEAIMSLYLYLMGPDSRGVTGQSLDAQGHWR